MSEENWIAIVGWNRLTHSDAKRGDGPLPWHRTYASLLDDDAYLDLPPAVRGLYHGLLLTGLRFSDFPGTLLGRTSSLSRKLGFQVRRSQLERLNDAGLIRFCASKAQAARWHAASPPVAREELEREKYFDPSSRSKTTGEEADYHAGRADGEEIETESTNSNPLPSWVPRAL